ncbi:hypothetical protein NFI96_000458 [Prochilodus magdalenae]|nr:hypothetical protein NFI96_000458 [Prochilodus magdalenae]
MYSCSITEKGCAALGSALKSNPSHLRELDLSFNKPGESGVKLLSGLLEDPHCKLEILHLYDCSITEEGCATLVSGLKSKPSHLRELNLSWNILGESGVKLLSSLLEDPHCKLEKLHLWIQMKQSRTGYHGGIAANSSNKVFVSSVSTCVIPSDVSY